MATAALAFPIACVPAPKQREKFSLKWECGRPPKYIFLGAIYWNHRVMDKIRQNL
jgi:hypothetical protein